MNHGKWNLLLKINGKEKNSITFTTSEWYIDMSLLRSSTAGLFRYPVAVLPEVDSGFEREKKKNDINDLQVELFSPYKRPKKQKR